jgi:hypothetical protein
MSGLRDALGEWSGARGEEVAGSVRVHERETRAAAGRRRARNLTLTAGAAVVAVVAASALVVGGPWRGVEPAVAPTGDPIDLGALVCGAPWTLEEGTVTHDESAPAYFGGVSGGWITIADNGEVFENPDTLWAGYESLAWKGTPLLNGNVVLRGTVVAVKDGTIVGVAAPARRETAYQGEDLQAIGSYPGVCGDEVVVSDSGPYTYHVVFTASLAEDPERPLQTIIDPSGPITLEVTDLEYWGDPTGDSSLAELEEPVGDEYQAFLVAAPLPRTVCEPYTDILANGEPAKLTPTYSVTIPGVQSLTGEIWGNAPAVVIDDETYEAWYVGLKTGITAQEVDGGNPLGALAWTTGTTWGEDEPPRDLRLINTADATYPTELPADCAYTQPIPQLSGAVFLIIDGVDWDALNVQNPGADITAEEGWQTWVYLGQAS